MKVPRKGRSSRRRQVDSVLGQWCFGQWWRAIVVVSVMGSILGGAQAQQQAPVVGGNQQWKRLFSEDLQVAKQARAAARKSALSADKPPDEAVGVSAPQVEYSQDGKTVTAHGGVVVSRSGIQVEADEASVDLNTKEAFFDGGVLVSTAQGSLAAEKGLVALDQEVGVFKDVQFSYDEGAYRIQAEKAVKFSDTRYNLYNTEMTTCDCRGGGVPWSLYGRRTSITQEGYAHAYGLSLRLGGVPVMYAPYFVFPVKTERAAGLLVPNAGISRRDGFRYWQPIFLPLDGSTDLTVTPFIETKSRYGSTFKYRQEISQLNSIRSKFIYSNESARQGSLRGLQVPAGLQPSIDTNRIGFMFGQNWRTEEDVLIPSSFAADIRYISDDEFLREIQDPDIGLATTIYQTSSVLFQSFLGTSVTTSLSAEYNQIIDFDIKQSDDAVFQRLPEASVSGNYSVYPVGSNPFGFKAILGGSGTVTAFSRQVGYDGTRTNLSPTVTLPFHVKNYVSGNVKLSGYETHYALSNVASTDPFSSSEKRRTGAIQYNMGTALEKTMEVSPDGFWGLLTGLGTKNVGSGIAKIKHTIDPLFQYTFIPDVSQDKLPLFDAVDRIRKRSLFTMGFDSSVFGKFEPRRAQSAAIPELVPRPADLPELTSQEGIPDMFLDGTSGITYRTRTGRQADVRELVSFSLRETYDYAEDKEDTDPTRNPFSDVWLMLGVNPTTYVSLASSSNISPYTGSLTSWSNTLAVNDDRGDRISGTYSYVNPANIAPAGGTNPTSIDQVIGNVEVVLTDRIKFGFYTRYDLANSKAIEQALALRLVSACNCWHVDVGMSETTNPNNQRLNVRFSLTGLGDLTQDWMYRNAAMLAPPMQ